MAVNEINSEAKVQTEQAIYSRYPLNHLNAMPECNRKMQWLNTMVLVFAMQWLKTDDPVPFRNARLGQVAKAHADAVADANLRVSTAAEEAERSVTRVTAEADGSAKEAIATADRRVKEATAAADRKVAESEEDATRRVFSAVQDADEKTKDADRSVEKAEEASQVKPSQATLVLYLP